MYDDNDLLDAQTRDADAKMPPAIVTFEAYFFPTIFFIQYLFILQMGIKLNFVATFSTITVAALSLITSVWQLVFGLIRYFSDTKHKGWQRYAILASINIGVLLFLWAIYWGGYFYGSSQLAWLGLAFLIVFPHAISWYYWYLATQDSELRQKILNGQR